MTTRYISQIRIGDTIALVPVGDLKVHTIGTHGNRTHYRVSGVLADGKRRSYILPRFMSVSVY